MPYQPINPADLDGEELDAWYRRSPDEIAAARQAAAQQAFDDFFHGQNGTDLDPQSAGQDSTSGFQVVSGLGQRVRASDSTPGVSWQSSSPGLDLGCSSQSPQVNLGANGSRLSPVGMPQGTTGARNQVSRAQAGLGSAPLPPGTPPLPSFISGLFGGPVPLHGPSGQVTGYYDHDAAKAGLGAAAAFSAIAPFFFPVGDEYAPLEAGTPVTNAVRDGIEEAVHGHHTLPRFMGGPAAQDKELLRQSLHMQFHSDLRSALKDAGFPNVGGTGGAAEDWARYFSTNPGSYNRAVEVLRRISADFDRAHGTSITPKLENELKRFGGNGGS